MSDDRNVFPTDERNAPTVPANLELAGLGRRVVGQVVDQLTVLLPLAIGAVAWGLRPDDSLSDDALLVMSLIAVIAVFTYETITVGLFGRSLGKVAAGTRIVGLPDGRAPGWFASAQRAALPAACGAVPQIGPLLVAVLYLAAVYSPLRQGLHDRAAGTIVVMK